MALTCSSPTALMCSGNESRIAIHPPEPVRWRNISIYPSDQHTYPFARRTKKNSEGVKDNDAAFIGQWLLGIDLPSKRNLPRPRMPQLSSTRLRWIDARRGTVATNAECLILTTAMTSVLYSSSFFSFDSTTRIERDKQSTTAAIYSENTSLSSRARVQRSD